MIYYQRKLSRLHNGIRHLVLFICCLLFTDKALSQHTGLNLEALQDELLLYSKIHHSGLMFVHIDKTLYTNNEPIWFSAYVINSGLGKIDDQTLLSLSLAREDSRQVLLEEKHVMTKGLSYGSIVIPENIPPGNYLLNACTNMLDQNGKPVVIFSQSLTIKNTSLKTFDAVLSLLDTVVNNRVVRAKVTVNIKDQKRGEKATIDYSIGNGKKFSADIKENSAVINIPVAQLNEPEPLLFTTIKYNYDTLYLNLKLPKVQSEQLNVRFFPEGGNLSDGLESAIGLETTTKTGLPVALTGILYQNDRPVDTISTNSYGAGCIKLKPDIASHYTFKVKANIYLARDSTYILPGILENGIVMHLNEAVIKDTLRMTLYSKSPKKVQVIVHNYREAFSAFNTEATFDGKKISMVVSTLPKGIATVSILDNEGKPLAERLFFAHYDHKINVVVKTEKAIYSKRDSVQVKISLKDQVDRPVLGLVSVAAVQESRVEGMKKQDIESYVYLYNDLGPLPNDPQGRGFSNKRYLEDMFLIRGWRRYTWQGLLQSKAADTLSIEVLRQFKANVNYYGKTLKKPVTVFIRRDSLFDLVSTTANGYLIFNQDQLQSEEGRKVLMWVNLADRNGYSININDPFKKISQQLIDQATIMARGITQSVQSSLGQLQEIEKIIALNTVTIKGERRDDSLFGYAKTNACGDYVCRYGVFKCPYHTPWNSPVRAPVKGEKVAYISGLSEIYHGCTTTNEMQTFGIYTAKEFYGLNREPESLSAPQYLSTLYWKPGVISNEKGVLSFSFFTGDITGNFLIIIQGVGTKDVIYGEGVFKVK